MSPVLRLSLLPLALLIGACAGLGATPGAHSFRFFRAPDPSNDPWFEKVEAWQVRERGSLPAIAPDTASALETAGPRTGLLRVKMHRYEDEERLALARRIAEWAQAESRRHYKFDPITDVAGDPWPTTKDLLDRNGDDCDGLDLITFQLLRAFGFPEDRLFRAIVRRDRDGANHMVTLWFEDEDDRDPWVVDAVGAVSLKVRRFSELPGWTPTKVFNARVQFTPTRVRAIARSD